MIQACVVVAVLVVACSRNDRESAPVAIDQKTVPSDAAAPVPAVHFADLGSKRGPSTEKVEVKAPVPGLTVETEATGSSAWKLTIKNDGDDPMSVLWDESSFVTGDGTSWRRLIPGNTRIIDTEKPHAPAPVVPHSTLTEVVYPEATIDIDQFGYDMRKELNGGRLYLAVIGSTSKHMWMGAITESDTKPWGWWCWPLDSHNGPPKCLRTRAECEDERRSVLRFHVKPGECASHIATVWCFIRRHPDGERISICFNTEQNCKAAAAEHFGLEREVTEVNCTERL